MILELHNLRNFLYLLNYFRKIKSNENKNWKRSMIHKFVVKSSREPNIFVLICISNSIYSRQVWGWVMSAYSAGVSIYVAEHLHLFMEKVNYLLLFLFSLTSLYFHQPSCGDDKSCISTLLISSLDSSRLI